MKSSQVKKIIVLIVFLTLLIASAVFMYNTLVKPSPYYPQPETVDE